MKKTIIASILTAFIVLSASAAEFAPTLLKINAPRMMGYDFDGSRLSFPVQVEGKNAGLIFCIFTRGQAENIGNIVNGYLGWHQVNKVDTCIYYSPLKSVAVGETVMEWDGKAQDGAIVPAGEYTYYIWAFDNQGVKQVMTRHMHSGWGFDMTTAIQEKDENGLPLANPIWYRANERWYIGNDPDDETLKVTSSIDLAGGWVYRGEPLLDPDDFSYIYLNVANSEAMKASIQKFKWVPGGVTEIQTDWGSDEGYAEMYSTSGGGSPGVVTDGYYLYTGDENHVATTQPDAEFYIYDYDGYMVDEIDLTQWWSNPDDLEAGGQMNGGPNNFFARNGKVFLNCHCNCLNQMIDPLRYLDSGEHEDIIVWSNGNGDYTLDHNFEETANIPWVCNDYNVGPYKYSISADDNLFSAANAYDVGAVSFGLLAPDGTGLGYYAFAGETAGWKKGTVFIDGDTPYDGIYCDNYEWSWGQYKQAGTEANPSDTSIYFIGHDSFKGMIASEGPPPVLNPTIILISPNGGESIPRNSDISISWRSSRVTSIGIEFSSDEGATWTTIAENVSASSGSWSWTVPNILSERCLIRVTDSDNPDVNDTSDRTFSIVRPEYEPGFVPDVENTGTNAIVLITADNPPAVDGVPLEEGDAIGVFTPRGLCAGSGTWFNENLAITIWGDDAQAEGTRGFLAGEPLTFKIWDGSGNKIVLVEAVYSQGDGLYAPNGIYIVESLDTSRAGFTRNLIRGWNTVSIPVSLPEQTIAEVLAPLGGSFELAKNGAGEVYWPEYGVDTIGSWLLTGGYQIYMNDPAVLDVEGYAVFSPDVVYSLRKDWSLIGYVGAEGVPPESAFAPVLDRLIVVKNGAGEVFWPEHDIDQIAGMRHGEGYWVYLSGPAAFSFPSSAGKSPAAKPFTRKPTQYFSPVMNTGNNATVLITTSIDPVAEGAPLTTGDEIAVMNDDGLCVGAGVWEEGKNLAIAVWGDDGMTEETDGMVQGETLLFTVWDAETGTVYDAAASTSSGVPRYAPHGLIMLESFRAGKDIVDVEKESPASFSLAQNTPNPFNPATSISFTLPRECAIELTVYNIGGAKIATLADGILSAGEHSVVWDASGFPSGVYFYRLKGLDFEGTGKMTLVK